MTLAEQRERLIETMCRASCIHSHINPDCRNPFQPYPGIPRSEQAEFYWQALIPEMTAIVAAISAAGFSIVADGAFDAFELGKVDIARKPE